MNVVDGIGAMGCVQCGCVGVCVCVGGGVGGGADNHGDAQPT